MQREATFKAGASPGTRMKLKQLLHQVRAARGNPRSTVCPYVFDLDSAKPFAMTDRCPCITPLRGDRACTYPHVVAA